MVTMRDVARIAGVSATTVSHVVNRSRRVDPGTSELVLRAIEKTGYAGHPVARSLRTGKTQTIGLASSAISNPYFGDVVHAVEQQAGRAGYSILLAETHDDPDEERRAVANLLSRRVDGLLVAPASGSSNILAAMKQIVPVVLIDRVPDEVPPGFDAVGVVNDEPNAALVDHLVEHGHTRIATLTSKPGLATTTERSSGYRRGIERNGLRYDARLMLPGDALATVEASLDALLALEDPPTALVLGNNRVTIDTMRALRRRRLDVPGDIAVVAFDDFEWSDLFHPRLTAVSQPVDELGRKAVELLLGRIRQPATPPRTERLQPQLHIRDSCGGSHGAPRNGGAHD